MNSAMSTRYEFGAVAVGVDGSASGREALIHHAHCPVAVVPASLPAEADTT
ncbi:hypothetical protein [Streptomyces sp. NBC_01423]|uniref:hypothetical protein n=1 Tax=Streptomyces sp. NBC_01423 TaxID=2903860 RepID=UPI002E282C64|nr:hypothetical protein [Streptomyces sp. NBC_01423]